MIGWRARVYQQGDFVLSVTCHKKRVTPEHAGALGHGVPVGTSGAVMPAEVVE
jgi:hypothetical protein